MGGKTVDRVHHYTRTLRHRLVRPPYHARPQSSRSPSRYGQHVRAVCRLRARTSSLRQLSTGTVTVTKELPPIQETADGGSNSSSCRSRTPRSSLLVATQSVAAGRSASDFPCIDQGKK